MTSLNAAIIGLGVGAQHAAAIAALPACRVAWLCDFDTEKLRAFAKIYPDARTTTRADDVLADATVDFVVIASYDHMHADQIVTALERGLHVFAEKPICHSEEDLARVERVLARHSDLVFQSNLILRRSPRLQELKRKLQAGDLGDLFYVEADYAYGRVHKIVDGWRGKQPYYSVMVGGGIHVIDTLLWLTESRVIEVHGYGNRIATRKTDFRFDDFQVALLRLENDLIAKVSANFGCVYPHNHLFAVYGTVGTFVQNALGAAVLTSRDPSVPPISVTTSHDVGKGAFIANFVEAIQGKSEPELSRREILESTRVCLAIDRAIRQQRTVQLEDMGDRECQPSTSLSASR
jgi:predicted dehydrogenase